MDSDLDATISYCHRVSGLPTSRVGHLKIDAARPFAEKTKDHLRFAFITVLALLCMAVFFYSALRLTRHVQYFNFMPVAESAVRCPTESKSILLTSSHSVPKIFPIENSPV